MHRVAALAAACILASCGGHRAGTPAIPPPAPERTEAAPEKGGNSIAVRFGGLQLSMALANQRMVAGEPLVAELALRNMHARPARVSFATPQRFDLIVSTDPGEEHPVTAWSSGQAFSPMRLEMYLKRDEVIGRTLEIPTGAAEAAPPGRAPFLPPGKYFLSASAASDPYLRTPASGITVLAPEEAAPDQH